MLFSLAKKFYQKGTKMGT